VLDISNTKLQDKNGIELFEAIVAYSQITSLNLSRNPNLAFKFSNHALAILKNHHTYQLQHLDISYSGIS